MGDASGALQRQLESNARMWQALARNGFVPGTEVEVDFFSYVKHRDRARALADALGQRAYSVAVHKRGTLFHPLWLVSGSTRPMPVTRESLDQWTASMVSLAHEHGADFDGCGLEIPKAGESPAPE